MKLLIVDDSLIMRRAIERCVSGNRFTEIRVATNGRAAVEEFNKFQPDVVTMDITMPDMDGIEATRRLRAWEQEQGLPPLPVIALTANAMNSDRSRCIAAGMDDHLPKPFRVEELLAVLQRHLPPTASAVAA